MANKMKATDFLRLNPKATFAEFFAATGKSNQTYSQTRYILGLSTKRKAKPKKKPEILEVTGTKEPSQQSLLYKRLASMENEMRGLRTVISYLEHQLGLKQSAAQL